MVGVGEKNKTNQQMANRLSTKRKNNLLVAGIVVLCTAGMGAFPVYYMQTMKKHNLNLTTSEGALSGQAVIRGVFLNSGSKDVGADPDWDVETRTWRGRTSQKQLREKGEEKPE